MARMLIVVQAGVAGRAAVGAGLDLAESLGWQVFFLRVAFHPVVPLICDPPDLLDVAAARLHRAEELRVEADLASAANASSARGVDCEAAVVWVGDPVARIARAATERGCDLVVVGAVRQGAIARLLHGNLARALITRVDKPVLVVGCEDRTTDVDAARPLAAARVRPSCSRAPTVELRR